MKKKQSKKKYSGDEVKRYLGSLSEDFQHKVSAIGEQFGGLNKKLDEHGRILAMHSEMLGQLNVRTMVLQTDVAEIKKDVQEIKTDLKQKVDRQEFARLERRVISLESVVHGGKSSR
ncbi:MAG: hypothetical protein Q7S52_05905 [bacterium]|nr:hypothetical protein [bacterium]